MANITLGAKEIGSIVKLNVNGVAKDFIVVHQGKPSDIYDDSCDGTWLLMQEIYEKKVWSNPALNDYENSAIHSYLNNAFLGLFDVDIQATFKQVKIPYKRGNGKDNIGVQSGENGLPVKCFLLSGYECGLTTADHSYFPIDGAKLDYFGIGDDGTSSRIARYNNSGANWWLRSPALYSAGDVWLIGSNGVRAFSSSSYSYGIRPALVLPSSIYVSDDGNVKTTPPPGLYIKQNGEWSKANDVSVKTSDPHVSIAFYDWDDTLLGTRAVKVGGSLIDPNTAKNRPNYVNEDGTPKYTDSELAEMGVAPLAPEGELLGTMPGNKIEAIPIYNKAGYSYAGWVDFSGTSTPDVSIMAEPGQTIEGNGQALVALHNLTESRALRAAYNETSTIGTGGNSTRHHALDVSPILFGEGGYLYTDVYVCRAEHSRRNGNGRRIVMNLRVRGIGEFPFRFRLGNTDFETYRILFPTSVSDHLNVSNAVSFVANNQSGSTMSNTVILSAAEIVMPAT